MSLWPTWMVSLRAASSAFRARGREWLSDAIAELIATTLTQEHIEAMADGELEGVYRPTARARPGSTSLDPLPARPDRVSAQPVSASSGTT